MGLGNTPYDHDIEGWVLIRKQNWAHILSIRSSHSFAKCNMCVKYKIVINECASWESRDFWVRHYAAHLMSQHQDRDVYYHERQLSVSTSQGTLIGDMSTVTIIIDAMDQAKFCVPRHLPGAKSLQDAMRPRLHMIGAIAHGYCKLGFVVEPTVPKDSNLFIEIVVQTLQYVMEHCRAKHISPPRRCIIVADNAGDNKNNWTFTCSCTLILSGIFDILFNLFLRTRHSHEDIDATFGYWATFLMHQPTLQTPQDFVNSLAIQFPDTTFVLLSFVRDFKDLLAECCVHIAGMGGSVGSCHSFTWLKRQSVDTDRYGQISSAFTDIQHPEDVVVLVRKYMHTKELNQPPLVALPRARFEKLLTRTDPIGIVPRLVYTEKQKKDLRATAALLTQFPYRLQAAGAYLESLADGSRDYWTPFRATALVQLATAIRVNPADHAIWIAPPNCIEPLADAKRLTAVPVVHKRSLLNKRRRTGRGRMSANTATDGPVPPELNPLHGQVALPNGIEEVLPDGDLIYET